VGRTRGAKGIRVVLAVVFSMALTLPTAALAAGRVGASWIVRPLAVSATPDAFEAGAGDDVAGDARVVTDLFSYFGQQPYTEEHTFDIANDSDGGDEDWIRFVITDRAIDFAQSYLIEAVSSDPFVDPVIELYGPDVVSATDPTLLGESSILASSTELDPRALVAGDDGLWFDKRGASVSLVPTEPGTYWARIRPYYQYAGGVDPGYRDGAGAYTLRLKIGQMTRLAGPTRIDTAVQISQERFASAGPDSRTAVVASAYAFPDALAGSTLAGVLDAPILLTSGTSLSPAVAAELTRLAVNKVYLLGGSAAVSNDVFVGINALPGVSAERVWGASRVQTAERIANKAAEIGDTAPVAFVVNSQSFPDALSAAPMAAFNGAPVLLTGKEELDPWVSSAIQGTALGITDVVIVGGTAAISEDAQVTLTELLGPSHVLRLAGDSRYETSKNFAVWATGANVGDTFVGTQGSPSALGSLDFNRIGIASGENFPDALAGGVFCGLSRAPILLTPAVRVSPYIFADYDLVDTVYPGDDYLGTSDLAIVQSFAFGGTAAITHDVVLSIDVITGPIPY